MTHTPDDDLDGPEPAVLTFFLVGHGGPGFYYYSEEYPETGSMGAFATKREAIDDLEHNGHYVSREEGLEEIYAAASKAKGTADDLRALGWRVAVHNDYMLDGVLHTFWLVTQEREDGSIEALKGEGTSDIEALDQIRERVYQ